MLKRIFLILLILASVGVIVFTLWKTDEVETHQETLLHHVPDDALLILDVEDARGFHAKLKDGSVLWPDLQRIGWASHLDGISTDIDSLLAPIYSAHPDSSISYILSLHPSGQTSYGWMLTISLGEQSKLEHLLSRTHGYVVSQEKQYNGASIYTLTGREDELFATLQGNILHLSNSNLALERALRAEAAMIMENRDFLRSYATRGKHSIAHTHVQWGTFPYVLNTLLPEANDGQLREGFAGWATSDILSDANSIYLHGLVQVSDSSSHHLAAYRQQGEGEYTDFLDLCPASTACYSYHHISRHAPWPHDAVAISDTVIAMLGTGYLSAYLESTAPAEPLDYYIIAIADPTAAETWLAKQSISSEELMGAKVYTEVDMSALQSIYGSLSKQMTARLTEEHLILTSSLNSMRDILLSQQTGRTLASDEHFSQLNDDMDDEVAICHYFNIARCHGLIENMASEELNASLAIDPSSLQQFQALVIQYSPASEGLFHQNVLLRHNPIYKKETSSLWELALDAPIVGKLHVLKNHYTEQYEALLQDSSHTLHLLDNTGRSLWQVALEEPIRSEVHQVDLYKNGKLQMAFNTDTRFIILDRNGQMLDGFPVLLSDTASSRLAVMDYDNKRKYRFLIGTQDGILHNYDREGKAVKGWKYESTTEATVGDLHHFLIGKKDYVCAIGESGSLRFIERNGKERFAADDKPMSDYDKGAYRVEPGKNIGATRIIYTDTDGRLMASQVAGTFKVLEEIPMCDLINSSGYLLHEDDLTLRYNLKGEEKLRISHEFDTEDSYAELLQSPYVGIADQETGLYYIYNVEGELLEGFPLPGSNALIKDMNGDEVLDVLLWDDRNISMYGLAGS